MTQPDLPNATSELAEDDLPHADPYSGGSAPLLVVALIGLASFAVWGYAYSGSADRRTPDLLESSEFAEFAGPRCTAAVEELETLPRAIDATDSSERALQIRLTNEVYLQMIQDLETGAVGTTKDVGIELEWLADWRTFVGHREDFADRFELDDEARFYVSSVGGERLEKRITRFANTNEIYDCIAPTDIG